MKKLLPYIAAFFMIAAAVLAAAFLSEKEIKSFTSFEGAEPVCAPAEADPFI